MPRNTPGMKAEAVDLSIAAAGSKATYVGAGVTGLGWFLSNQFFGLMSVLIALAGLPMNWHYKRKAERLIIREAEQRYQELQMRMVLMRAIGKPVPAHQDSDLGRLEFEE